MNNINPTKVLFESHFMYKSSRYLRISGMLKEETIKLFLFLKNSDLDM